VGLTVWNTFWTESAEWGLCEESLAPGFCGLVFCWVGFIVARVSRPESNFPLVRLESIQTWSRQIGIVLKVMTRTVILGKAARKRVTLTAERFNLRFPQ
jgi:hypothetical protein